MPRKLSLFTRMGGKFYLRDKIVQYFPDQWSVYIEPFVGSGQVFLELPLDDDKQYILNDLHPDIYHIWKDLQVVDEDMIAKYDFQDSKELFLSLQQTITTNPDERLFRNLYLSYYSFSGLRTYYAPKPYKKGNNFLNNIHVFKKKMKDVVVLNKDYQQVLEQYDCPDAVVYMDPPYFKMEKYYEKMAVDPQDLASVCRNLKGKFVLSYDASEEVKRAFQGFHQHTIAVPYTSGLKHKVQDELLIMNYD